MSEIARTTNTDAATALAAAKQAAQQALAGAGALVPLGGGTPEATKHSYALQRAEATRALNAAKAAAAARREEIRRAKEELERSLQAELAGLEATLAPLREQAAKLEEGLWTVNLYLGRDEEITRLAEGAPAPADEPIVLRQLVLAMDEECLIAANDGGIDAARREDFLDWLTRDPAHLQQVLPDRKGVVVLVPSRQKRDYGHAIVNKQMEEANQQSHWLIRNGDNLYVMVTNLKVDERLLPKRDEFMEFFYTAARWEDRQRGITRVPLEPGGDKWLQAEQAADYRRRHYMRIMLVLQGLVDRTTVFQPLPAAGVNFLSLDSQDAGKVRIVNEIDNVLTAGRKPFRQWQAELNAQLRPGMRIIGEFAGKAFHDTNTNERDRRWGHSRLTPEAAERPDSRVIHTIEAKSGRDLKFLYRRTREEWIDHEYRVPKTRAACVVRAADEFILPFDLVTEGELAAYLNARTERHAYLSMVPVLKAAIAAKQAERAQEGPFRVLLAGRLAQAHGLDVDEVAAELPSLVDWWKLTNRHHRALVTAGNPDLEAKAIRGIEREFAARLKAAGGVDAERDARAVEELRRAHTNSAYGDPDDDASNVICVARRRDGSYVAYCPEPYEPEPNIWLTEHRYSKTLTGYSQRQWVTLPGRTRAALTILWAAPEWDTWNHDADTREHLTRREYHQITGELLAKIRQLGNPIAVTYARRNPDWDSELRHFSAYAWAHQPEDAYSPDRRGISAGMVKLSVAWRRGRSGDIELEYDRPRHNPQWERFTTTSAPWESKDSPWYAGRPHLIWSDKEQLAKVHARQAEADAREKVQEERDARQRAIWGHVAQQWVATEEQRHYARFLEDYAGAEDLWEGHRKTIDIHFNAPDWLWPLISRHLEAGTDLAGMTVAAAVAAHPAGTEIEVPEDLADLVLVDPPTETEDA